MKSDKIAIDLYLDKLLEKNERNFNKPKFNRLRVRIYRGKLPLKIDSINDDRA